MKKINWALIGCGKVVLKNKITPFNYKNNKIIAICTTNICSAQNAAKKLNINCNCYSDAIKMIKENKIDAIYICTPPAYHFEYLIKLSKYNIPIYVEKPFTISLNQSKKVYKTYSKSKTPLYIAHYKRLSPKIQTLKKIIDNNEIGKIRRISGIFHRQFSEELLNNSWVYNSKISGGGRYFDIAPHIYDCIYYLFGALKRIKSNVVYDENIKNCENIVETSFYASNILCTLEFNLKAKEEIDILNIYGEDKRIELSLNRGEYIKIFKDDIEIKRIDFKQEIWGIEAVNEIEDLIKTKKNVSDICTFEEAYLIHKYINKTLKK